MTTEAKTREQVVLEESLIHSTIESYRPGSFEIVIPCSAAVAEEVQRRLKVRSVDAASFTTSALDDNKAGNADFRAAGRDLSGKWSGPTSRPLSRAGDPLPGKIEGCGWQWASDIPTVLRQAAERVGALASEAATMACDLDAQAGDLKSAEEAICNFAEQRNEAMREVDRLLAENAELRADRGRATDLLAIALDDVERAADRFDFAQGMMLGMSRDIATIRASRDEACGLLREARNRIVELEQLKGL